MLLYSQNIFTVKNNIKLTMTKFEKNGSESNLMLFYNQTSATQLRVTKPDRERLETLLSVLEDVLDLVGGL